jgi:hypothetical protein
MALQNKLKAFVRYDGSGRVIPSSLILQKSKPKVGNWKEINATQCCNDTPTTTTTTTGSSAFLFNVNLGYSAQSGCAGVPAWNLYAATPFLGNGTTLYYNSQLTQPYDGVYGSYIKYQNVVYTSSGSTITNNGTSCSSITTTTTTTADPFYYYVADQYTCPGCGTITGSNMAIKATSPIAINAYVPKAIGGQIYAFKVLSSTGPNYMATAVDAGGASDICPCPGTTTTTSTSSSTTTTTTTAAPQPLEYIFYSGSKSDACNGLNQITLYMNGTINYGKQLYTDAGLTTLFIPNSEIRLKSTSSSPNDAGIAVWYTYSDGRIQWQEYC